MHPAFRTATTHERPTRGTTAPWSPCYGSELACPFSWDDRRVDSWLPTGQTTGIVSLLSATGADATCLAFQRLTNFNRLVAKVRNKKTRLPNKTVYTQSPLWYTVQDYIVRRPKYHVSSERYDLLSRRSTEQEEATRRSGWALRNRCKPDQRLRAPTSLRLSDQEMPHSSSWGLAPRPGAWRHSATCSRTCRRTPAWPSRWCSTSTPNTRAS